MEALYTINNFLILFAALAIPQLLGLLVHYRMKRFPRLSYLTGFVITLGLSLFLLRAALFPPPPAPEEYVCGLAVMGAVMAILFFTGIQAVVSVIAQYCFYRKHRA